MDKPEGQKGYFELSDDFIKSYIKEFGERKAQDVWDKIVNSQKVIDFLQENKSRIPKGVEFLYCINEIPFFITARGQTQALGGILMVKFWNEYCNGSTVLATYDDCRNMVVEIINISKPTFF